MTGEKLKIIDIFLVFFLFFGVIFIIYGSNNNNEHDLEIETPLIA
jgi:hypothetical protein